MDFKKFDAVTEIFEAMFPDGKLFTNPDKTDFDRYVMARLLAHRDQFAAESSTYWTEAAEHYKKCIIDGIKESLKQEQE
jgi:hypothetical protein